MILSMQEKKVRQITCKERTVTLNSSIPGTKVNVIIIKGRRFYKILVGQIKLSKLYVTLRCSSCQGNRIKSSVLIWYTKEVVYGYSWFHWIANYIQFRCGLIYKLYFPQYFIETHLLQIQSPKFSCLWGQASNTNEGRRPDVLPWYIRVFIWGF